MKKLKSFASMKRDLQIGDTLTLVESPKMPNNTRLNVKRYIVGKQTNGLYLSADKNASKGSFLDFPNAKLVEYDGEEIRVYDPGTRPLTDQENRVWKNRPSQRPENKQQLEFDILSDTNILFWKDKQYFRNADMGYLHYEKSSRFNFNSGKMTITDKQLKGELVLRYVIGSEG
jgi:hypothetical protein